MARGRRRSAARKMTEAAKAPFTIQCVWMPTSENPEGWDLGGDCWRRGDETAFATECRLWSAAERYCFNRLVEGRVRDGVQGVKPEVQRLFGVNSRYANDAWEKAQAIILSQQELIPIEIEDTQSKLDKSLKKQRADEAKERRLRSQDRTDEADRVASGIAGRSQRVRKLETKLDEYRAHQENGTIPTVVFGGKKLWRDRTRGKVSAEQWRAARRGRLWSQGDRSKDGNPNIKIASVEDGFNMSVAISHLVDKGKVAPTVSGALWVPEKYRHLLVSWLASGDPYSVEIIRDSATLRVHVSGPGATPVDEPDKSRGVLGCDINPDGLAFYNLDAAGNRQRFPKDFSLPVPPNVGKYPGDFQVGVGNGTIWLKAPDWTYARAERRDYLIGVAWKLACDAAAQLGKPLALEGLGFAKDHDTNRVFNRMSSNFPYAAMLEAAARRAAKTGVGVVTVNPAMTSAQGRWKYMTQEGLSVHQASAKTIGRRALGKTEKFDPSTRARIAQLRHSLTEAAQAYQQRAENAPTEGTRSKASGIAKRLVGSLSEERLSAYNARRNPPWRTWAKRSPWGSLVEVQRYRWSRVAAAGTANMPVGVSNRSVALR